MRERSYRLTPAAVEDLEAIVDYLRERNPMAAVRFVEAARATFEHLEQAATAYPKLGWGGEQLTDLRRRPMAGAFPRYVVFYREDKVFVDVVRVLHSARDIESLLVE